MRMNQPKLFAALLFLPFLGSCGSEKEFAEVEKQDLIVSVYASALIRAEGQHELFSTSGGPVTEIPVNAGDSVAQGDLLMRIRNTNPLLNEENAKLALELARKNYSGDNSAIQNLKVQLEFTRLQLKEDSLNLVRQQNLWAQKIGSKSELERRQLAYSNSKSQYELLLNQIAYSKDQAFTALQQAENNFAISQENREDFEIRADMDGLVYALLKEKGELVRPQEAVAVIGSADSFYAELEVDEEDITQIQIGQEVVFRLDAIDNRIIQGKVRRILPLMDKVSQSFTVEADIEARDLNLLPELTGEANIVIETRREVLNIPLHYVLRDSFVLDENGEEVAVEFGLKNMERIEVRSGLNQGDKVYKQAAP